MRGSSQHIDTPATRLFPSISSRMKFQVSFLTLPHLLVPLPVLLHYFLNKHLHLKPHILLLEESKLRQTFRDSWRHDNVSSVPGDVVVLLAVIRT